MQDNTCPNVRKTKPDTALEEAIAVRLAAATDARDMAALERDARDARAAQRFDGLCTLATDSARRIYLEAAGLSPVDAYNIIVRDRRAASTPPHGAH